MRKLFLALIIVCLTASLALATNATKKIGNYIDIIPDGSTDWDITVDTGSANGVSLNYIAFYPSAANDVLVVRDRNGTGVRIFTAKDTAGGGLIMYYDGLMTKPYIKAADCTFGTAANVRILMAIR